MWDGGARFGACGGGSFRGSWVRLVGVRVWSRLDPNALPCMTGLPGLVVRGAFARVANYARACEGAVLLRVLTPVSTARALSFVRALLARCGRWHSHRLRLRGFPGLWCRSPPRGAPVACPVLPPLSRLAVIWGADRGCGPLGGGYVCRGSVLAVSVGGMARPGLHGGVLSHCRRSYALAPVRLVAALVGTD